MWVRRPRAEHCAAVGAALARLHLAGEGFALTRAERALGRGLASALRAVRRPRRRGAARAWRRDRSRTRSSRDATGRSDLPEGVIHADLFPDNVFFLGGKLSGLIDFYFACNDMLAYDVAVCLNAWCFETDGSLNVTKARALLAGYAGVRPFDAGGDRRAADCLPAARRCASC